ncbi:serine/threonine-protein phosphatase 2A regulatory subunit B'' subunit gamma-like [Oscarella lobularis]|uniref:serine/threonine-protein phosphatase 2A regulatory subunit B'' subunit gamma-like n=1 Tax=Oscarella lobularis TaxID=121494 RepID=UPI00331393B8
MSWLETSLKRYVAANAAQAKPRNVAEEREHFSVEYAALKAHMLKAGRSAPSSSTIIPRFYFKPPRDDQILHQKLREEARAAFLQRKSAQLLDNEELQALWTVLEEHSGGTRELGGADDEKMTDYSDFARAAATATPKARRHFTSITFAKLLEKDAHGRVSTIKFFNYVMRKVWLHQTRIGLSLYDVAGLGYLRESDLENYIFELIPTLPQLDCLEKSFYSFYVCTAVRKFFFFLDPLRTGRVKIVDMLASSFLDDLLELREEELAKEAEDANWFSAPSALRVYGQYLNLDTDHNGMLSKAELAKYGSGTLTSAFVERVFQECLTYEGEMDYKTYLDFVLAMENKKEPQAVQYFFRLLDVRAMGSLNVYDLHFFFRSMQEMMQRNGQEVIGFQDVKDEIFDMVKPADPLRIALQDLISSGQGGTVVSILIDLNGFWTYENREVILAENAAAGGDQQQQQQQQPQEPVNI